MTKLSNIINSSLLIENYHLNFHNIEFDDNSLIEFVNNNKNYIFSKLVTTIEYTQELTDSQKNILNECFPNLIQFNYVKITVK